MWEWVEGADDNVEDSDDGGAPQRHVVDGVGGAPILLSLQAAVAQEAQGQGKNAHHNLRQQTQLGQKVLG